MFEVRLPERVAARTGACRSYASIRGARDRGRRFDPEPAGEALDRIGGLAPREVRRACMTAFGHAERAGRSAVRAGDLPQRGSKRPPIGFMHRARRAGIR